jgi:hypothetical protein
MKNIYYILGFLFNFNYIITSIGISLSGYSIVYLLILVILIIKSRLVVYKSNNNLYLIILLISFFYCISFIYSTQHDYSKYKFFMFFIKLLPLIVLPYFLKLNILKFMKGYFLSLSLVLVLIFIKTFFMQDISVNNRLIIGDMNPIWISRIVLETLLLALLIFNKKKIWLFMIIPVAYIIFLSGSKGPLLSFIIVVGFYYFNNIKSNRDKFRAFLLLTGLSILMIYIIINLDVNSYIYQRFLLPVPDNVSEVMYESSRVVVWPETVSKISNSNVSNLLFGNGIGSFGNFYHGGSLNSDREYPHNILLELIVEQGVVFLILFIITIIITIKYKNNFKYVLIFYLLNACFSGDILNNEKIFLYIGLVNAYNLYFYHQKRRKLII